MSAALGTPKGKVLERRWNYGTNGARVEGWLATEEGDATGNWVVRTRLLVEEPRNTAIHWSWTAYPGEVERRTIAYHAEQLGDEKVKAAGREQASAGAGPDLSYRRGIPALAAWATMSSGQTETWTSPMWAFSRKNMHSRD